MLAKVPRGTIHLTSIQYKVYPFIILYSREESQSVCMANLEKMIRNKPVKFQKDRLKTVGGVAHTRYVPPYTQNFKLIKGRNSG